MVNSYPQRFSVWLVNLDPKEGSEQAGTRPVLVISPDEMNKNLRTVIVAPMTTRMRGWATRIPVDHAGKSGEVALDQIRTIDKVRFIKSMGNLNAGYHSGILNVLTEIFEE